jgi:crotonobetainyl-CoA:carnitine CoA-transferase CaiB-like acyl-CoA transferase
LLYRDRSWFIEKVIGNHPPTPGALDGLLVADFSSSLAGPYLTMLLGDLGATIVKVESPGGDATRAWGPPWHRGDGAYFHAANRNKRSVVLDLKVEEHRALARELATRADVLVENLRADGMSKFGLAYEELAEINPRLVYCSISGFGRHAKGASLSLYDLVIRPPVHGIQHTVPGIGDRGSGIRAKVLQFASHLGRAMDRSKR